MLLGGLVLDVYDDCNGDSLKALYPTREDLPYIVKTAHALESEERGRLPDDVFALVLTDDSGTVARKYACVDPGNTILSVGYFLLNRDKLPLEAQKTAAANLITACGWYDMDPPEELSKIAGIGAIGSLLKPATGALKSLAGAAIPALGTVSGLKDLGSSVVAGASKARGSQGVIDPNLIKSADVTGTHLMPIQPTLEKGSPKYLTTVKKAALGHLVQGKEKHPQSERPDMLEQNREHKEKNPELRQHAQLVPYVNVQGAEPPSPTKMKVSHYALRDRYPLDTYEQVKTASAYFDEYWKLFDPEDRHEYCLNMVKRAHSLGIGVSELAERYGSPTYAPAEEISMALDSRRSLVGRHDRVMLDKLAAVFPVVEPEVFALALSEFDKAAGLAHMYDRDVVDPFYSTFGLRKEAEYNFTSGPDYINESDLRRFAANGFSRLCKRFGKDVAEEFVKDPVAIFESLPLEQKRIVIRLAMDAQPSGAR